MAVDQRDTSRQAIGPWSPRETTAGVVYVRDDHHSRVLWLEKRDELPVRKRPHTKRVCLVGESAAAGMFYAPAITPARMLAERLAPRGTGWEVIDMSRNAMRINEVVAVVTACQQLLPDWTVVFAGNNFIREVTAGRADEDKAPEDYLRGLRESGLDGLLTSFRSALATAIDRAVESILDACRRSGTRLLWILPAVSPLWRRATAPRWSLRHSPATPHKLVAAALEKLREGDPTAARRQLEEHPEAQNNALCQALRFEVLRQCGDWPQALEAADSMLEQDALVQGGSLVAPGLPRGAARHLDLRLRGGGAAVVDAFDVLELSAGPQRCAENFIDYCHLTPRGMSRLVGAVASRMTRRRMSRVASATSNEAEAIGDTCAAIYRAATEPVLDRQAHRGRLELRFAAAIAKHSAAADLLRCFVRMNRAGAALSLTADAMRAARLTNSRLDFEILRWIPGLHVDAINAICCALETNGYEGDALWREHVLAEAGRLRERLEIAHPRHLFRFSHDGTINWHPERGTWANQPFLKSHWPALELAFAVKRPMPLWATMTYRTPHAAQDSSVEVWIDGDRQAVRPAASTWSTEAFALEPRRQDPHFVELRLVWPEPETADSRQQMATAIERYAARHTATWQPVFGELFSLRLVSCLRSSLTKACEIF